MALSASGVLTLKTDDGRGGRMATAEISPSFMVVQVRAASLLTPRSGFGQNRIYRANATQFYRCNLSFFFSFRIGRRL
jgi:hypothetical protein